MHSEHGTGTMDSGQVPVDAASNLKKSTVRKLEVEFVLTGSAQTLHLTAM